jgi:DNA-binding NarL/FixJ family response regulator
VRPVRVLVADPLPIFRAGVRNLLRRERDLDVIEAGSFDELQRADDWPDLALVDADLPPKGALPAVEWLSAHRECATIVWSFAPTCEAVLDAIRAGARGYLHKEISGPGLVRSLRGAVRGEAQLSRELVTLMIEALHGLEERDRARARITLLSPREHEVLALIVDGAATRTIADALDISEFTVKRHVQNIFHKLDVESRGAAAAAFRRALGAEHDVVAGRMA